MLYSNAELIAFETVDAERGKGETHSIDIQRNQLDPF